MTSRTEVEAQINARLKRTGIAETLTLPRTSDGCATPHVEGEAAPFDFVVAERGKELRRDGSGRSDRPGRRKLSGTRVKSAKRARKRRQGL